MLKIFITNIFHIIYWEAILPGTHVKHIYTIYCSRWWKMLCQLCLSKRGCSLENNHLQSGENGFNDVKSKQGTKKLQTSYFCSDLTHVKAENISWSHLLGAVFRSSLAMDYIYVFHLRSRINLNLKRCSKQSASLNVKQIFATG